MISWFTSAFVSSAQKYPVSFFCFLLVATVLISFGVYDFYRRYKTGVDPKYSDYAFAIGLSLYFVVYTIEFVFQYSQGVV